MKIWAVGLLAVVLASCASIQQQTLVPPLSRKL